MTGPSEPPPEKIETPSDEPIDLHGDRTEQLRLQQNRKRNGVKAQQIVGGVVLALMVIGGGIYWVTTQNGTGLRGADAETAITTPTSTQSFADLVIASKGEPEVTQTPQETIVNAAVPASEFRVISKDSDATLRRLTELTEKNAEAAGLISSLRAELRRAEKEASDLTQQVNNLETENKRVIALGETERGNYQTKLDQMRNQFESQISVLRGELELAKTQAPTTRSEDEQRLRLEEARKRRQAQIESEALIYDGSEEENSRAIRY